MNYIPTILDAKSDILRSINSTYSKDGLNDKNFKYFLKRAISTLNKSNLDGKKNDLVAEQIAKAKKPRKDIGKVREDLLLITSLI